MSITRADSPADSLGRPALTDAVQIGPVRVPNRIFMPPHGTNYADVVGSPRLADYYGGRAKRGVGLIIHEAVAVHPSGVPRRGKIHAWKPEAVDGFARVAGAVHAHGVPTFVQLLHGGRQMNPGMGMQAAWAASSISCRETRSPVHPITEDEIRDVVGGFAASAANVARGGLDGVEVHAAHGYLISGFMSPYSNRRTDGYGGGLAGRMRFPLEVLEAVSGSLSSETVLGIRVSAEELVPDGMSIDDVCEAVDYLRLRVRLDYLSVSLGNYTTHELIVPDHSFPPVFNTVRARQIREALSPIPVLIAGRIRNGEEARAVVEGEFADMVGIARGLIADPDWALSALAGEDSQRGRPCIYCNEDCRTNVGKSLPLACSVNPRVGSEDARPVLGPDASSQRIVVVGGGPAGMTAALRASELGVPVTLYEAGMELGGQLRAAARDPGRAELRSYLESVVGQVETSDVDVHLNARLTGPPEGLDARDVVMAVGGIQRTPAWVPTGSPAPVPICASWDELTDGESLSGRQVVVIDDGEDGWALAGIIEHLLSRSASVTLVTEGPFVGYRLPPLSIRPFTGRLEAASVRTYVFSTVSSISEGAVHLQSTATWKPTCSIPAERVVYAGGTEPTVSHREVWESRGYRVSMIGDGYAPRGLGAANRDAVDAVDVLLETSASG